MSKYILAIAAIIYAFTLTGQAKATTDAGEKVLLNSDGTWEYIERSPTNQTSSVFVGGKNLTSGVKTTVHYDSYGFGLETSVSLAKEGDRTLIIFWQETTESSMNFHNWLWTGNVVLYLDNNETVTLVDRNFKGQNKIANGNKGGFGSSDLYQRFSCYYLTPSECLKLKKSNLSQIAYQTTDMSESGTTYLRLTENTDTAKAQLAALKR